MITISNHNFAIGFVSYQKYWRERVPSKNIFAIFFYMRIADTNKNPLGAFNTSPKSFVSATHEHTTHNTCNEKTAGQR